MFFIKLLKREEGKKALIDFLNAILDCKEKIVDLD